MYTIWSTVDFTLLLVPCSTCWSSINFLGAFSLLGCIPNCDLGVNTSGHRILVWLLITVSATMISSLIYSCISVSSTCNVYLRMRAFQKYIKSKQNMPKCPFTSSESERESEKDQRRSKRDNAIKFLFHRKKFKHQRKFSLSRSVSLDVNGPKCRWVGFLATSGEVMAGACLLWYPTESGVSKG